MSIPEHLESAVRNLPALPGCYLYHDKKGEVIYVGKAVNLRNRVRSYFNDSTVDGKTRRLVREIAQIEFMVRGSELEALIQEAELIKKYRPRFNILLKDDKRYPYLKITWQDSFPTVMVTRRFEKDGARYYGPYSSAKSVYATRDVLRKIFPFLNCDRTITGNDARACMYFDIKLCNGPCIGAIQRAEYRANIQRLCDFLEGKSEQVIEDMRSRMERAAENLQFERAAELRDQLRALETIVQKQRIVSGITTDQDVIAFARDEGETCVEVLFIRSGKLLGQEYFVLDGADGEDDQVVLNAFVERFYEEAAYVPPEVVLPHMIDEAHILENWLGRKRGGNVQLRVPRAHSHDDELVSLARQNARETLSSLKAQWQEDSLRQENVLKELQDALELPRLPTRIECYDVSNFHGTAIVGAMAVFVHGVSKKSDYRRFNITGLDGPNDFESMRQMLTRRLQRWKDATTSDDAQSVSDSDKGTQKKSRGSSAPGRKKDEASWVLLPDLMLIDGGKGQLSVAREVLASFDLAHVVPLASLAKREEEIFMPGRERSILLPRGSQSFFLVQRVRDEAHRYGITSHRRQRNKIGMASQLDSFDGVGPTRRRQLLKRFGSLEGIRTASIEALAEVVPHKVAQAIKDML
ncbi:MAG: excinuclease ABC subunit UvrC [Chloroflexi bacterium]|nr:excinuclease ABC subunit UvrC [Chloroflexota bacterium]